MTNADAAAPAGLLGTKYSQALRLWRGGVRLYRASEDGGDWYERRPRPRTSTDTGNEYTLLISEFLPSWRGFPKRNRCVIAAGRRGSAAEYLSPGRALYCVLPSDGALVAVAPSEDMWDSFPRLREFDIATINEFNGALRRLLSAMCGGVRTACDIASMFAGSDTEALSALFRAAEDNVRRRGSDVRGRVSGGLFAGFMISGVERGRSIVSLLDEVLSPEANGFAARRIDGLRRVDTEVWTDADCLLVKCAAAERLLNRA